MIISRTAGEIASEWRGELDANLESGAMPVFYLGANPAIAGDLPGALAVQSFDEERSDVSVPFFVGGGVGAAWLAALLHQRGNHVPPRSPGAAVAYGGPDAATHAASLAVWHKRNAQKKAIEAQLPAAFQPQFAPHVQAGEPPMAALPFVVAGDGDPGRRDGWTAWAAVAVAIALLLIAMIA